MGRPRKPPRTLLPVTMTDREAELIKHYAKRAETPGDQKILWSLLDRAGLGRGYTLTKP